MRVLLAISLGRDLYFSGPAQGRAPVSAIPGPPPVRVRAAPHTSRLHFGCKTCTSGSRLICRLASDSHCRSIRFRGQLARVGTRAKHFVFYRFSSLLLYLCFTFYLVFSFLNSDLTLKNAKSNITKVIVITK